MAAVTGATLQSGHRLMLVLIAPRGLFGIRMTGIADKARLFLHQFRLVGAMHAVTVETIAIGKGHMDGIPFHLGGQVLVTAETEFAFGQRFFEKAFPGPAVRIVTSTAGAAAERFVGRESA